MNISHYASLIEELKVLFSNTVVDIKKQDFISIIKVLFTFTRKKVAKNKMKEISTEEAVLT